jgi:hypothetical protein
MCSEGGSARDSLPGAAPIVSAANGAKSNMTRTLAILLVIVGCASRAAATTISIQPSSQDAYIQQRGVTEPARRVLRRRSSSIYAW